MSIAITSSTRPVSGAVRLTRRGRVVLVVLGLVVAALLGVAFGSVSSATQAGGEPLPTAVVTVNEGDTLWGIAAEVADDGEVRQAIAEIKRLNAMESSMISLGQKLLVPLEF